MSHVVCHLRRGRPVHEPLILKSLPKDRDVMKTNRKVEGENRVFVALFRSGVTVISMQFECLPQVLLSNG
jgi:hypothetical protein